MVELAPQIAAVAAGNDAVAAEAATRALVRLGPKGLAAGAEALSAKDAKDGSARLRHLRALEAQRAVEREVLSRWRRKGGSYRGRFESLRPFGFEVQPILVAMLLDVPLEDQFVVIATTGQADLDGTLRGLALSDLAESPRRGYRTFDPLPATIEAEELFTLASQALADVGDLDVVGPVLRDVHNELMASDRGGGFRARPWERRFAEDIAWVLSARGDPALLEEHRAASANEVTAWRRRLRGAQPEDAPDDYQYFATKLAELAGFLHQLGKFDEAAKRYREVVAIHKALAGSEPAVDNYNLACALARGGHKEEALVALARAIDPTSAAGIEDLTREWVTEDGDLASLHGEPAFEAALLKRFGAMEVPNSRGAAPPGLAPK